MGIGDEGSVVPVDASSGIDDTKITTANPWSSSKIVETVCPPFEVTGPIVTCNPMAGTPLHVVSQIVPMQEGEGDPSPENVRPITGWDNATLMHNDSPITLPFGQTVYGGTLDWATGVLTITHGIVDMGTLVWVFNNTVWGGKPIFYSSIPGKAPGYMIQSTSYKFAASATDPYQLKRYEIMGYKSDAIVYVYDDRYDSSDAFAKSVSGETIVYQLKAPITIQLTPREILALSGVNTIYTDTGDTTVSGRADPITIINQLATRIAALESVATNL